MQADDRTLRKAVCDPTQGRQAGLRGGVYPRNLTRTISADLDNFLWGLALWLNEGIETGRWGNGTEEAPYSSDSKNLLLSEIVGDGSDKDN